MPKLSDQQYYQYEIQEKISLSIKGSQYWFEYDGAVNIDEEQALDIKKLLDLLGQNHGRFIPLATGEFIALTEKFRKQLEDLRTLSDGNKVYHLSYARDLSFLHPLLRSHLTARRITIIFPLLMIRLGQFIDVIIARNKCAGFIAIIVLIALAYIAAYHAR